MLNELRSEIRDKTFAKFSVFVITQIYEKINNFNQQVDLLSIFWQF